MRYVYILASKPYGTLYVGVTHDLRRRVSEHKTKYFPDSFTAKYDVDKLVYYEAFEDYEASAQREVRLKRWNRAWKIELIQKNNPERRDLFPEL